MSVPDKHIRSLYTRLRRSTFISKRNYSDESLKEIQDILSSVHFATDYDAKALQIFKDLVDTDLYSFCNYVSSIDKWHLCLYAGNKAIKTILKIPNRYNFVFNESTLSYDLVKHENQKRNNNYEAVTNKFQAESPPADDSVKISEETTQKILNELSNSLQQDNTGTSSQLP